MLMGTLGQDLRYALRNLGKTPGFAIVAMITLALGIGASTAIFSVIDNILMEPFPYPDAQRFMSVLIHDTERSGRGGGAGFSGPEFLDYVEQNHVFDRVIANDNLDVLYRSGEGTERFNGNFVTPGTFEFLGAPPVFVLRYKTWVKHFGADPRIVNKTFALNGTARTLIGIMPPRFGWGDADMWIPAKPSKAVTNSAYAGAFPQFWFLLGHLKPGVSMKEAQSDLTVVAQRLATVYPKDYPKHFSVQVESLTNLVVGRFRTTLFIVLAAVGLLLLIGCGNVANLAAGKSDDAGKGVCHPVGAGGEPMEIDPAASGGEHDAGDRRSRSGNGAGLGRTEVSGGVDAAADYPGGGGDKAEYTGAGVHAMRSGADGTGVRAGAGAEGGAKGLERTAAGQQQGDQRGIPARKAARCRGGAGGGAFADAAGGRRTADAKLRRV